MTADQVTVRADQYAGMLWVDAPDIVELQFPDTVTFRLRGSVGGPAGSAATSLYVQFSGSEWSFLQAAFDSSGKMLPMRVVDRRASGGGIVREVVSVGAHRQYLEEHRATGLDIEVRGRRGKVAVKLPPAYVEAFLAKFDAAAAAPAAK
ncbi:MAG: hypothetical protein WCK28_00040 [Burkholderiales bacterium]